MKWTDEPPTGNATLKSIVRGKTICETYPPGPVYVSIDTHIQEQPVDETLEPIDPDLPRYKAPPPMGPNEDALAEAAEMIVNAEFPVLVGGRFGVYERMREPDRASEYQWRRRNERPCRLLLAERSPAKPIWR